MLLKRNADHLRQSAMDGTPFAAGPSSDGPLSEIFGLYGTNTNADALLWGELALEDLPISLEITAWLEELAQDNGDPSPIDVNITKQQFQVMIWES